MPLVMMASSASIPRRGMNSMPAATNASDTTIRTHRVQRVISDMVPIKAEWELGLPASRDALYQVEQRQAAALRVIAGAREGVFGHGFEELVIFRAQLAEDFERLRNL